MPDTPPEAPAPVCIALTVSSTAPRISDTRISDGRPRQTVAAAGPAHAFHQTRPAQLDEELLQIGQRDVLPPAQISPAEVSLPCGCSARSASATIAYLPFVLSFMNPTPLCVDADEARP